MIYKIYFGGRLFLRKCKRDNISAFATQAAYFIILSIIPLLIVFTSMLKYTPVSKDLINQIVHDLFPGSVSPFMIGILDEVYAKTAGITTMAAIFTIWSAARGFQYLINGLNVVNGIEETRNWFVLRAWSVLYTAIFVIAMILVLILTMIGNEFISILLKYFPLIGKIAFWIVTRKFLLVVAGLSIFFTIIFKALPNRKTTIHSQMPGAILCALAWYIFSFGVSVYVNYFKGFSMYGSLSTVVVILLWLYFCMYILLMCQEINCVCQGWIEDYWKRRKHKGCH